MKKTRLIFFPVIICFLLAVVSCDDLSDVNTSPDKVDSDEIDLSYVLNYVLAKEVDNYLAENVYGSSRTVVAEAMQYIQHDYLGYSGANNFNWSSPSTSYFYESLANAQYIYENYQLADGENAQNFYRAVGLVMRSFWFGTLSSFLGDIPYSEALKSSEGNYSPAYDNQIDIFKGVLAELEEANTILAGVTTVESAADGDIMYGGDPLKWQKFANSLRLRFCIRLSEKTSEMSAAGVDVKSIVSTILSNSSTSPIFESNDDNASFSFAGTDEEDSWTGGPLYMSVRSEFYRRKPAKTFVNALRDGMDPRLTTFINPVDVQIVVNDDVSEGYALADDGTVKRYISTSTFTGTNVEESADIDTSMYVGLAVAMKEPDDFNLNNSTSLSTISNLDEDIYTDNGANPHCSYLADIFAEDANPLVKSVMMSYSEVLFLVAEARYRGWVTSSSAVDYYKQGIEASLGQYEIADGSNTVYNPSTHQKGAFDKSSFLSGLATEFSNASEDEQLNLLMTQKWIALFMTAEFWSDWRRNGYPNFAENVISGANGSKIPVRYMYGDDEYTYNAENVAEASSRLGGGDTQWSKMWLLEDTENPW